MFYNQFVNLPLCIKTLSIDYNILSLIDNLPIGIEELYLGENFNLELNNLPNSIKIIKFNIHSTYNEELNNLPKYYSIPINNINFGCYITYYL